MGLSEEESERKKRRKKRGKEREMGERINVAAESTPFRTESDCWPIGWVKSRGCWTSLN